MIGIIGKGTFNIMSKKNLKKYKKSGLMSCEICGVKESLDTHHIRGRDIPHCNSEHNLVNICCSCHRKTHTETVEGYRIIVIEGWFNTTNGRELIWRHGGDDSITGQSCTPPLLIKQE